jgi:hypothetical protein
MSNQRTHQCLKRGGVAGDDCGETRIRHFVAPTQIEVPQLKLWKYEVSDSKSKFTPRFCDVRLFANRINLVIEFDWPFGHVIHQMFCRKVRARVIHYLKMNFE